MNLRSVLTLVVAAAALAASQSLSQPPTLPPTTTIVATVIPTTVPILLTNSVTVSGTVRPSILSTAAVFSATTVLVETYTPTPTFSSSSSSPSPTEPPSIHLDTKVNGAFAVAGVLLILSGLPMAFWGHKNRWSSFFLIGFYTFALTCLVLVIRFGVLQGVKPPTVKLQGLFLLSSAVAGIVGGGIFIFFWKAARHVLGAWGGFAFGLWIQSFHTGGLIKSVGFRWFLYIGLAAVGFIASTFPPAHYSVMLLSTAFVGASALVLGVDCFSTAGLKEFYMWNLGFTSLFPTFSQHDPPIQYPISQTMMIEIGLIGALALMGTAVQFQFLQILRRKLREITAVAEEQEREREERAARQFENVQRDRELWEKEHGTPRDSDTLAGGGLESSGKLRSVDLEAGTPEIASPAAFLPTLQFGRDSTAVELSGGIVPGEGVATTNEASSAVDEDPEIREKLKLLDEIRRVRQNIDALREPRSSSPTPTTYTGLGLGPSTARPVSTISMPMPTPGSTPSNHSSAASSTGGAPPRPPRGVNPADIRPRTKSMGDFDFNISNTLKLPEDPDKMHWDEYTKDRKLFTPPSGVTPPIPTSEYPMMSPAVREALEKRRAMEEMMSLDPEAVALAKLREHRASVAVGDQDAGPSRQEHGGARPKTLYGQPAEKQYPPRRSDEGHGAEGSSRPAKHGHTRSRSFGGFVVLPSRKPAPKAQTPDPASPFVPPPRFVTSGELDERHRKRLHQLQEPLSREVAEQAKLDEAKGRWERSRATEKAVMERKEKRLQQERDAEERERTTKRGRKSTDTRSRSRVASGDDEPPTPAPGDDTLLVKRRSVSRGSGIRKAADWQGEQRRMSRVSQVPSGSSQHVRQLSGSRSLRSPTILEGERERRASGVSSGSSQHLSPGGAAIERRQSVMSSRSLSMWHAFSSPGMPKPDAE
ncbi:hypothetical protein FRB99_007090 [Tulasnella sp. 403]|nr:hypothetical protein FRB99_007090 [Tulasnella sp. 403]